MAGGTTAAETGLGMRPDGAATTDPDCAAKSVGTGEPDTMLSVFAATVVFKSVMAAAVASASAANKCEKNVPAAVQKNPARAMYVRTGDGTADPSWGTTPMPTNEVPNALSAPPSVVFQEVFIVA